MENLGRRRLLTEGTAAYRSACGPTGGIDAFSSSRLPASFLENGWAATRCAQGGGGGWRLRKPPCTGYSGNKAGLATALIDGV